jgi:hypothetical protein
MRRLDQPDSSSDAVPAALLDHLHPVWLDAGEYARWCDRQGIQPMTERTGGHPATRWHRFAHGRTAWARLHDITRADRPGS